ncbi:hypothetical protein LZP69_07195 [Shewanella sp. AS1]|uniref:hypothetical protein n=1 Tax=Shewanella sp. AS1 TaxID=2907626 RepID=UPI001F363DB4|nr:hypothetical protein [Shewanella sp. AS1]MCE9678972.1 hypothetical protein [Shewanella sp. AS1]
MGQNNKLEWFEQLTKKLLLVVGVLGVVVIYFGFFYLLFTRPDEAILPWYILLSPWICIYFGLSQEKQLNTLLWLQQKLLFWRKPK